MSIRRGVVFALLLTATSAGCAVAQDDEAAVESGDDALTGVPKEGSADAVMLVAYLNDATTTAEVLLGIGVTKKTAAGIAARRAAKAFTSVADVMSVSGVGASTVTKLVTAARAHAGAPAAQDLVVAGCGGVTMNVRLAQGNGEAVAMFRAPLAPELDIAVGFDDAGKAHAYYASWDTHGVGYQVDLTLEGGKLTVENRKGSLLATWPSAIVDASPATCKLTAPTTFTIKPGKGLGLAPQLMVPPARITTRGGFCLETTPDGLLSLDGCAAPQTWSLAVGGRLANGDKCLGTRKETSPMGTVSMRGDVGDCHDGLRISDGRFKLATGFETGCLSPKGVMVSCDGAYPAAPASWYLRQDGIIYATGQQSVLAFDAATKKVTALASFYGEDDFDNVPRWDLLAGGLVRERRSGLCLSKADKIGTAVSMVACDSAQRGAWQLELDIYYPGATQARAMVLHTNGPLPTFTPYPSPSSPSDAWRIVF
jgi:hypothetical protein